VDQYHRLIEAGILGSGDAVELLEGLIVLKGDSALAPPVRALPCHPNGARDPALPLRRFRTDEYQHMVQAGILGEDEPVELVEGWILHKMPRNPPHDSTLLKTLKRVEKILPDDWQCRPQLAVVADISQPEPDLAVVRGPENRYDHQHPGPSDVGALIEIADTSLALDRALKGPAYARINIPVYWIVNLPDRQVEVYTDPTGATPDPRYRQRRDYGLSQAVPLILDGREVGQIRVRELLPT
jgi:Uma2 family endonuclease